ncbi:hypothetical protein AB3N04_09915 [Alkalihalophilus sp. As8PL]|uniref:Phosphoglyceromutase n=1 Tax=Alkalihalophilus sp. As8PL TaxID=3237103 RepID=A0AB39BYA9_9BACI
MWKRVSWLLLVMVLLVHIPVSAHTDPKLTVILVPSLSFDDAELLWEHGENQQLWQNAALGAVNVKPDGPYSYLNNMVSLGSGGRAAGIQEWNSYEIDEMVDQNVTANQLFMQLNGVSASYGLVHPLFHRLVDKNKQSTHQAQIGSLGDLLNAANINRFVLGHSDTNQQKVRYGSLLAIDSKGIINGAIASSVESNQKSAFGMQMDSELLYQQFINKDGLLVIEWGDLYRLYEQRVWMDQSHFKKERMHQLKRLEAFIARLVKKDNGEIWLLSPMMNKEAYDNKQQLAPLYIWHKDKGGYVHSVTTNQSFLLSNIDIVPSILSHFGLDVPSKLPGNNIIINEQEQLDKAVVFDHVNELTFIYKTRANVLSTYITTLVLLLITAGGLMIFKNPQFLGRNALKVIILSALCSPLPFLIGAKLLIHTGVAGFVLFVLITSLACGYLVNRMGTYSISIIGGLLFFFISLDLVLGTPFMQRSYLGYDPIIGARYYGIGNEYAGVYIIAGLAFLSSVNSLKKSWIVLSVSFVMLIQLILLGYSEFGTNAGATISAGIAYSFFLYRLLNLRLSFVRVILLGVISVLLLFFFLYMLQLTGNKTHIGAGFNRLLEGDFSYIFNTMERKLTMNWKIFRHSNWTQLFVTSYVVVMVMLFRKILLKKYQIHALILQTGVTASIALLLLNDSGVVAAATSMFCVVSIHYYWLLEHKQKGEHEIGEKN